LKAPLILVRNQPKSKTKIKEYLGEAEKGHYQNYSPR